MTVYFYSDPHFSHKNLANNVRGYADINEHDEFLIEQFNSIVKSKHDLVYFGGDITLEKKDGYSLLDRLNGRKVVIMGNHDLHKHCRSLLEHVENVCGVLEYKGFVVTHIPIHESQIDRFRGNIHGHLHNFSIDHPKYFNMSCEVIDYKPKTVEELIELNKIKFNLK